MAAIAAGNTHAGSPARISPTTTDALLTSTESIGLCPLPDVMTTILSVTLPPGNWLLTGTATLQISSPFESQFCHLLADDVEIAVVRRRIGAGGSEVSTLTLTGALQCSIDTEVRLECWHERLEDSPTFVDAGATIWAHKSEELQILTQ
jgi:hypothetical protein